MYPFLDLAKVGIEDMLSVIFLSRIVKRLEAYKPLVSCSKNFINGFHQ